MDCSGGACTISHNHKSSPAPKAKATKPSSDRSYVRPRPVAKPKTGHEENCAICDEHQKLEEQGTPHIHKHLHQEDHSCHDHECEHHGTPHGHIKTHEHEHEHKHDHTYNHDHSHEHDHHHDHPNTLESIIGHSKLPQWLKELSLNLSFLSPALIISKMLSHTKLPQIFRTLAAITGMHALNRGKTKLGRLGLTYLISGAAAGDKALSESTKHKFGLGTNWTRFIATTCVAVVEKFAGNGHGGNNFKEEVDSFKQNVKDPQKWKELWPSLVNVESKVQVITPLVNKLIKSFAPKRDSLFNTLLQIVLTSARFVGFDQILKSCASIFGKGSAFASIAGTVCGCCGTPVCAAAATNSALSDTF